MIAVKHFLVEAGEKPLFFEVHPTIKFFTERNRKKKRRIWKKMVKCFFISAAIIFGSLTDASLFDYNDLESFQIDFPERFSPVLDR